jgi:hypothetical protein
MNQTGQEGAGFRLMVEALLGIFILLIILGVIVQIDNWRTVISEQRLYEGFSKSLNSPDGSVIVEKSLVLKNGSIYSSEAFAESTAGIDKRCIEIQANRSFPFDVLPSKRVVELKANLEVTVYYKCLPGRILGEDQCQTYCFVSFAEELEKED